MAEVEINISDEMLEQINQLAIKQYGDGSETSKGRVIETALKMRTLWSCSIMKGQDEIEEAISRWEFSQSPIPGENDDSVNKWLFRR
ncbi:MAG: hypothetical protein ABR954_02400 [Dehalococcoidales bacterium]